MKVLHVVSGLGIGGAESQLREILRHTGHAADVVTLHDELLGDGDTVRRAISDSGVRVHTPGPARRFGPLAAWRLWRILRRNNYDVVHTHRGAGALCGRLAARWAGAKVIVDTAHPRGEADVPRRCVDAAIAASDVAAQRLVDRGARHRKVTVIPHGVDVDALSFDPAARALVRAEFDIADDVTVIGTVGRLRAGKRCHLLIDAAAPLLGPRVKLLIAGDGVQRARLAALAGRRGVAAHVLLAGQRADVPALLSALDVFVAAGDRETSGQSVLEALANGLPTLYTTCPALDGIETAQARRMAEEVQSIRRAMRVELEARRPRTEVPELRERYAIEAVAEQIDTLYTRLWSRRTGRPAVVDSGRATDFCPV